MKFEAKEPARVFLTGLEAEIEIKDCGDVFLDANEQVTFKTALVRNPSKRYFVMLVEEGREEDFHNYLSEEKNEFLDFLDEENLDKIYGALS